MVAINEVIDQEGYLKQYLPTALKTLKEHGGVLIAGAPGTQITKRSRRYLEMGKHGRAEPMAPLAGI